MPKHKGPTPHELYWQRKHAQDAYIPPGLINHGNTCFMNSVLQGLIATHLLADLALFNEIPESVQKHSNTPLLSRRSPQLTNGHGLGGPCERSWIDMPIGDRFLDIMYHAWTIQSQRKRESLSPKDLLAAVGRKYDQYLDFAQQDAHEFLRILLDAMRMEEQDVIKQRQPLPQKQPKKRRRSSQLTPTPPPALSQLAEEDKLISFADMIFGGKLTSILVCQKCKHISQTYEDFNDISLSLKPEDYVHGRKRDRLRNFAKKLSVFPSSSLAAGMQIQRSSSVPPSPREREDAQLSEKPLPHVVSRRRSMEHLQSDQQITTADSGESGDAKDTTVMESDGSNVIVNEVSGSEEKHIEFAGGEKKEKKKKDVEDSWAKLGRRISMTVSLGKKKNRKSGASDSSTSRKVSTTSIDNSPQTTPTTSVQPSLESTLHSALSPPPTVTSPSPSLSETKDQQLLPPPVVHPTPVRTSSSPSHSLPRLGTHIQRSKSPKLPKQTPEEQAYLRRILADVVPGSTSSGGNGAGSASSLSRLKQTSHHLHLPGTHVNGKSSSGGGFGVDTSSVSTGTSTTATSASTGMWLPLGVSQFSGLEECLRMFTAVEVLDGENMVGCRRCWKIANGVYEKREEEESDDEAEDEEDEDKEDEAAPQVPLQSIASSASIDSSLSYISYTEHGYERGNRPTTLTRAYTHPTIATTSMMATPRVAAPPSSRSPPSPQQGESPYNDPTTPTMAAHGYRAFVPLTTPGGLPIPSIDISGTALEMDASAAAAGDERRELLSSVGEGPSPPPLTTMGPLVPAAASWDSLVVPAASVLGKKGGKKRNGSGDGTSPSASASSAEESEMTSGSGSGEEESDAGSVSSAVSDGVVGGGSVGNGMLLATSPPPGLGHAPIANANSSVVEKPQPKPKSRPKKKKETILRPAYKRYLISVPPPVLVIHMKRFQQMHSSGPSLSFSAFSSSIAEKLAAGFSGGSSGSGGSNSGGGVGGGSGGGLGLGLGFGGMGGFKKLEEFVSFPEWLDLGPFLAPKKEEFGLSRSKSRSKKGRRGADVERCMYRLYAVVVHIGNMLGGHYVAYTALPSEPPWANGRKAEGGGEMESKEQQSDGVGGGVSPVSPLTLTQSLSSPSLTTASETTEGSESVRGDGDQRARRQWAYISDTNVRIVPLEEVLNARAYLCMYERV